MATIRRHTDIAASPEQVWSVLEDVRRLPEYSSSTREVRDAPERLTQVGQNYVQIGTILGMPVTSRWEVVAVEPGQLLSSVGIPAPGVRYTLTQRLEPLDGGSTRLSIDIDYSLPGGRLGRLAATRQHSTFSTCVRAGVPRAVATCICFPDPYDE